MFYHSILKTGLFSWSGGLGWSTSEQAYMQHCLSVNTELILIIAEFITTASGTEILPWWQLENVTSRLKVKNAIRQTIAHPCT